MSLPRPAGTRWRLRLLFLFARHSQNKFCLCARSFVKSKRRGNHFVGTQFIASANDVSDAMNRVPTIQRMHSSKKSLLPSPDDACGGKVNTQDGRDESRPYVCRPNGLHAPAGTQAPPYENRKSFVVCKGIGIFCMFADSN